MTESPTFWFRLRRRRIAQRGNCHVDFAIRRVGFATHFDEEEPAGNDNSCPDAVGVTFTIYDFRTPVTSSERLIRDTHTGKRGAFRRKKILAAADGRSNLVSETNNGS